MTIKDDGLRSSAYWSARAEETRAKAGDMSSGDAQSALLDIAAMYERMAKRAAEGGSEAQAPLRQPFEKATRLNDHRWRRLSIHLSRICIAVMPIMPRKPATTIPIDGRQNPTNATATKK